MTKETEIKILRDAAAKLGSNSYCGQWLSEQIPFAESALRSDVFPYVYAMSMAEAEAKVRDMITEATKAAAVIVADAHVAAEKIRRTANDFASHTRASAKAALTRIAESI